MQCIKALIHQYLLLALDDFSQEYLISSPLLTSICVLCRIDYSMMTDRNLKVAFYSPTNKHSENNSDNRNETWKQELARKNFLVTIKSVSEKSDMIT